MNARKRAAKRLDAEAWGRLTCREAAVATPTPPRAAKRIDALAAVIRAVQFDLDDTLIDHRQTSGAAMAGVRERFAAFQRFALDEFCALPCPPR